MKHWYIHQILFWITHTHRSNFMPFWDASNPDGNMCMISSWYVQFFDIFKNRIYVILSHLFPGMFCHDSMKEQNVVVDDCDLKLPQNEEDAAGNHLPVCSMHSHRKSTHSWNMCCAALCEEGSSFALRLVETLARPVSCAILCWVDNVERKKVHLATQCLSNLIQGKTQNCVLVLAPKHVNL